MKTNRIISIAATGFVALLCAGAKPFAQSPADTTLAQQRGGGAAAPRPPAVVVSAGKPTVFLWPNGAPGSEARKDEAEAIKRGDRRQRSQPVDRRFSAAQGDQHRRYHVAPGGGIGLWIMHEG
jgi:hypothetical protein